MARRKIIHVVGARPNFMKVAPILREMSKYPEHFENVLVHTGQHYDANMSKVFFDELGMPEPDIYLGVGSGTHGEQTARVLLEFEQILIQEVPESVLVVGDVNSTLACALAAVKRGVRVIHVEAGLRSFDRTMPEEINRVLTDQISDLLFVTEEDAIINLEREGVKRERICFVGNVMIDSLVRLLPEARQHWEVLAKKYRLNSVRKNQDGFVLVTLHRPSNVDNPDVLAEILQALTRIAKQSKVLFPVHPRTRSRIAALETGGRNRSLTFLEPLGYLDFLALMERSSLVITDSGGVQEETTFLKVPCVTVRPNTERPVTIRLGTNRLVESTTTSILGGVEEALADSRQAAIPPLWDGEAAMRIVEVMIHRK